MAMVGDGDSYKMQHERSNMKQELELFNILTVLVDTGTYKDDKTV